MREDSTELAALDTHECLERLATAPTKLGRVAFVREGYPVILPVNYSLLDGAVVFRSGIGGKADAALRGALLGFEVDTVDATLRTGWSVLIKGRAEVLTGDDLARARRLGLRTTAPGHRPWYFRIRADAVTGRQISPARVRSA